MLLERDKCWLGKQISLPGVLSFFIDDRVDSFMKATISREVQELFGDVVAGDERADILFRLSADVIHEEGYLLEKHEKGFHVYGKTSAGLFYGLFALYRSVQDENVTFPISSAPGQKIRMLNHWDNFDGSIERGYAGETIFYKDSEFRGDLDLIKDYARLLASVGINGISINNVNVHKLETFFITKEYLEKIKPIVDVFTEYQVKVFLAINFAAPKSVGGLTTADPLDEGVIKFWQDTAKTIYDIIPNFGGFIVKADSEGEPGPFAYNRNHDDGANMLAHALQPFGGTVIWRCFVYNCLQDWRNRDLDRARAAYDIFKPLDGKFADNVTLQIKNGPIDFQIREPQSPLFGGLEKTNHILEFQITQEYTGHQIDTCYLVPMWKETMDFETGYDGQGAIKKVLTQNSPNPNLSGIAAVCGVGMDLNWMGHKLSQSNLYGFGRMIWDNDLSAEQIAKEWVKSTFTLDAVDQEKILHIMMTSRDTYEDYNNPLSVGFMCKPHIHYGVSVDGYEYDRWGTYHYADRNGIGRDRTVATGTGFTRQYSDARFAEYENLDTIPDEYLLFFHHVPYTHLLKSGKTVIQHIYDSHFEGVEKVESYQEIWSTLKGKIDDISFENVRERLVRQHANAIEWRDQINTYFWRKSGIADKAGRKIYD